MNLNHWDRTIHIAIYALLAGLIVISPMAMGSVAPWARSVVLMTSMLILSLWLMLAFLKGRMLLIRTRAWPFILGLFAVLLLQVVPLPISLISTISPGTIAALKEAGVQDLGRWTTLSLYPYGTCWEIARIAAIAAIFLVVVHTASSSKRVIWLLIPLLAIAVFECFYGFAEQFSGHRWIFWTPRTGQLAAVTGTFRNKNHFAGLLEMALPAALGLLLAILAQRRSIRLTRAHMIDAVSSGKAFSPLVLSFAIILMASAICLSLSRAGILCTLLSIILLAVGLSLSFGFRKYTLALLALVGAVMITLSVIGASVIVERVEDVASGRSASWTDRLDLAQSGMAMVRDFPIFGSGIGTFRYVFEKYQSARFGDRIADFLHNDWLQLACETGLVGALFAAAAMFILFAGSSRRALARKNPFCRWVSIGALAAVAAMLAHSLFDYNLLKITSNGIIFAVLLGIGFSAARMHEDGSGEGSSNRHYVVPLGPVHIRFAAAALVIISLAVLSLPAYRVARADIAANRFIAGSGVGQRDPYYFLPLVDLHEKRRAHRELALAIRLDPRNPRHHLLAALNGLREAENLVAIEARKAASLVAGQLNVKPSDETIARLVSVITRNDQAFPSEDRKSLLAEAVAHALDSVNALPIASLPHMLAAQAHSILARADSLQAPSARQGALDHARLAVRLAPNKPGMLFGAGEVLLEACLSGESSSDTISEGLGHLKRAVAADPKHTTAALHIAETLHLKGFGLFDVTPDTLRAQQRLADYLWKSGNWNDLLACLDKIEALCDSQITPEQLSPWILTLDESRNVLIPPESEELGIYTGNLLKTDDLLEIRLAVSQRRATVLGIVGRWDERDAAVDQCRRLIAESSAAPIEESHKLAADGEIEKAYTAVSEVLVKDWSNPSALLLAADLAEKLKKPSVEPYWDSALDHLYRLVILNESLPGDLYPSICQLLERISPRNESERTESEFIRGASALLCGNPIEAQTILESLTQRISSSGTQWRQRHLPYYYLGRASESIGDKRAAVEAYNQAMQNLPNHLPSLRQLTALGEKAVASSPGGYSVLVPCKVDFGGRIRLSAYSMQASGTDASLFDVICYWEYMDRLPSHSRPLTQIFNDNWLLLSQESCSPEQLTGTVYPMEYGNSGEGIFSRFTVRIDSVSADYLQVQMRIDRTGGQQNLFTVTGEPAFLVRIKGQAQIHNRFAIIPSAEMSAP